MQTNALQIVVNEIRTYVHYCTACVKYFKKITIIYEYKIL